MTAAVCLSMNFRCNGHKCMYLIAFHQYVAVPISKDIASSVKTLNSGYALSVISTVTMHQQWLYAQL